MNNNHHLLKTVKMHNTINAFGQKMQNFLGWFKNKSNKPSTNNYKD